MTLLWLLLIPPVLFLTIYLCGVITEVGLDSDRHWVGALSFTAIITLAMICLAAITALILLATGGL